MDLVYVSARRSEPANKATGFSAAGQEVGWDSPVFASNMTA